MVALDVGGAIAATRLHNVGVKRALHEEGLAARLVAIQDAARILEAQNEVVYAEERKLSEIPVVGIMQAD